MEPSSVECGRCYLRYEQARLPTILSCGHTFCAICVNDNVTAGSSLECFACARSTCKDKLRTNYTVLREAERVQKEAPKDDDIDAQIEELLNKNVAELQTKLRVQLTAARRRLESESAAAHEAEREQRANELDWIKTLEQRMKEVDSWCSGMLDQHTAALDQARTQRQQTYDKALSELKQALKDSVSAISGGSSVSLESKMQLRRRCQKLLQETKKLHLEEIPELKAKGTISLKCTNGSPSLTFTENSA